MKIFGLVLACQALASASFAQREAVPRLGALNFDAVQPVASVPVYQPQVLNEVLKTVQALAATGASPVVLFDIDDTLTNTAGRQREIIRQFARRPEMQADEFKADSARLLEAAQTWPDMPYDKNETTRLAGIANPKFAEKYDAFWQLKFFANDLLPEDPPNPGAADFVRAVIGAGGTAAYFTGRDAGLLPGTIAALRKNGFPVPGEDAGARIFLKKDPSKSDAEFKAAQIREWRSQGVQVAGGFDNEPANINAFKKEGPEGALMVFVDTKHSSAPIDVMPGIPRVRNFIRPSP